MTAESPIRIGVSSCVLGNEVRYDGTHKQDRYVTGVLGNYFQFVPVCPEVEVGMGVPRETVRLEGPHSAPRMVAPKSGRDWTHTMTHYARRRARELRRLGLSAFILQKNSPSCGMERVKVFNAKGHPTKAGSGLFAAALKKEMPILPVEEEGRLEDLPIRENFLVRVFAYARLQALFQGRLRRGAVVEFHSDHKYLLMAHSPERLRKMGRMVADIGSQSSAAFRDAYGTAFMQTLSLRSTVPKNVNVLQHLMGHLKKKLDPAAKADLLAVIDDYHQRLVPLIVPITLVRHYLHLYPDPYLERQVYLRPHPKELMLRNHV